jgi:uncharacterized membrane protein
MKNKNVGFLIVGIAVVMAFIVLLFNNVIKQNLDLTCSHGSECEMYSDLNIQTWISLSIVAVVLIIGLFLVFSREQEKIIIKTKTKTVKEKKKPINLSGLDKKEKEVVKILQQENRAIFQKTLMEKLEIGKVGITRLLDKLEAKQIIERKRRGMNNIVVLRD